MEGEIESEPLALKNIPDIVNRQLVRVSVLYSRENSRENSTKSWEVNGDSLIVASFLTTFFASARTSDQLLSQPLISFSWNNALKDQPVDEEVEDPTNLLVQLGTEWS